MPTTLGGPNLITDGDMEGALTGWSGYDGISATVVHGGVKSLRVTFTPSDPPERGPVKRIALPDDEVPYSFGIFVAADAVVDAWITVDWLDASMAYISTDESPLQSPASLLGGPYAWTPVVFYGVVAPAGAAYADVTFFMSTPTFGFFPQGSAWFDDAVARQSDVGITVQTEDAAPLVAPHRISPDPAHDDVAITFAPIHDGHLVPTSDLVPSAGTIYPDEGWCPDDPLMVADRGAIIPGVARDTVGYVVREGGLTPNTGQLVRQVTNRCSVNRMCGTGPEFVVRDAARELRVESAEEIAEAFTYADVNDGGADGPRDINVWVLTENQGWT